MHNKIKGVKRVLSDTNKSEKRAKSNIPEENSEDTTNLAQPIGASTGGPATSSTETPMQIDLPEGNEHNQGGTLQGESGTRKQQKQQGAVFGLIKVSLKMSYTNKVCNNLTILYDTKEKANDFFNILNYTWKNIKRANFVFNNPELYGIKLYGVCIEYNFKCKWATLEAKFGKCLTGATRIFNNTIQCDIEGEDIKQYLIDMTTAMFRAQIRGIDIAEEITKEENRLNYMKRKADGQDESNIKKFKPDWGDD